MKSRSDLLAEFFGDVTYTVTAEPEDIPYKGNCMVSGDPAVDKECEDGIRDQLAGGNELAWCQVKVSAYSGDTLTGSDCLGAVSCKNQADLDQLIEWHGMKATALADLSDAILDRLEALQARGKAHGEQGWYPDGDFSSDADWVYGPGAEINRLGDLLGVDDDSVFRVYADAHSDGLCPNHDAGVVCDCSYCEYRRKQESE